MAEDVVAVASEPYLVKAIANEKTLVVMVR
jgi:hypothetical protein